MRMGWDGRNYGDRFRDVRLTHLLTSVRDSENLPLNTSDKYPIRIDWVNPLRTGTTGKLGMTLCPGRKGVGRTSRYDRDLEEDLARVAAVDTHVVVTLLEDHEFKEMRVLRMIREIKNLGMESIWFPIVDGSIPKSVCKARDLVGEIVTHLRYGRNVMVHCKAGQGRTGTIVSCGLVRLGYEPDDAILVCRQTRKGTIESQHQENFVKRFQWHAQI